MAPLAAEDFIGPAIATIAAALQFGKMASACGKARKKFKIDPPEMDGPDEFKRINRAYMNCVEFLPLFLSVLWVNSIFCHQAVSLVLGLLYVYTRHQYFLQYCKAAKARASPFHQSVVISRALAYSAMGGIALTTFKIFSGIDIVLAVRQQTHAFLS